MRPILVVSRVVGVLTALAGIWALAGQVLARQGIGRWHPPADQPLIAGLLCICPWAAIVLGTALVIRGRRLATYAIVLWLVFPFVDTLEAIAHGWWAGPFQYRVLLLAVVPFALATRLFSVRHVLPAIAVTCAVFVVRNLVIAHVFAPKVPVWMVWVFGRDILRQLYYPAQWVAGGIGAGALAAWGIQEWLLARRRLRRGT